MDKKTILLADDQLEILKEVVEGLSENYSVETVSCGNEAEGRIKEGGLDLIIVDGSMPPGPKGDYIARQVREQSPNIPIILQSGNPTIYKHLEEIGVRVMDKFDRDGIIAYVKETLK